jgi:uncharacterized protein involved in cysteine biosynthesis
MDFIFKHFKKFWLITIVANILLVSGIAWVVIHFIRKFW